MEEKVKQISALLTEAGKTHHIVYRIVDGDHPDWASWYADWLLELSELPKILGKKPVRSHLVHAFVEADRQFTAQKPAKSWQDYYAKSLLQQFS
ncbi:hypothetical protein HY218_02385 [Candidatus Saccharibacteria bacterium]|nr:hypothetical protein [Candidatus Saccharibacteria bacterium]